MEEWVTAISTVGFPIIAWFYIMIRVESKLDKLTESINALERKLT